MKRYTDSEVRAILRLRASATSYREVADSVGMDAAYLHRIAHGERPLTPEAAQLAGFVPVEVDEHRWIRRKYEPNGKPKGGK